MLVEIACCNWESCLNAVNGGAHRIELFENLPEGGCTPSYSLIEKANQLSIPVYVMIRPRGGNFVYTEDEFDMMKTDLLVCKRLGASGVVFGILTSAGEIDVVRCRELLEIWQGPATFHRAFDEINHWDKGLQQLIELGFERVLSSGQSESVDVGKNRLKEMIESAGANIIVMPGCGVTAQNAKQISEFCKNREIHATCKSFEKGYWVSDETQIIQLVQLLS